MALSNSTGRLSPQSMLRDRYIIIGLAGRGGMGCVYKAIDTLASNRLVAIKEMSQATISPEKLEEAQERFHLESEMLGKLSHPNLPCVLDAFAASGRSYLVMDFIDGKTLLQLLTESSEQQLPVEQVLRYAIQLCMVLEYLHKQSPPIVFRDLKPSNVMITAQGEVYLIDFGIARHFTQGKQQDTIPLGSEGFCPPEQFGTGQTSPRSDLYSLGATLYYSLTGKNPRSNKPTLFDFVPLTEFNPQVPGDLNKLILWMVATREEQRPQNAAQVRKVLQSVEQWTTASTNNTISMSISKSKTFQIMRMNSEHFYDTKTARAAQSRQWLGQFNVLPGPVGNWCALVLIPVLALVYGQVEAWLSLFVLPVLRRVREGADLFFRRITEKDEGRSLLLAHVLTSPIWTPYFVLLFLLLPLLLAGGCFYWLVGTKTGPPFVVLCLCLFLLLLSSICFTSARIGHAYAKKLLVATMLVLMLLILALLSLQSVQMVLQAITPNRVLSGILLGLAFFSLLRPHSRFVCVDHLSLMVTMGVYAFLQYCYGLQELALLGRVAGGVVNTVLVGILGGMALTMALRIRHPFTRGERVLLCVVSCIAIGLQYTFGLQEIAHVPLVVMFLQVVPIDLLDLVSLNILLAIGPLVLTLLWLFLPQVQRSARLARVPLLVLALTGAGLQNFLGSALELRALFGHVSLLAMPVVSVLNLAQVLAFCLLLLAFLLGTRLVRHVRWFDHSAIFSISLICALLQSAAWDRPMHFSTQEGGRPAALLSSSIATLNQPQFYTAAYNKLLAQGLMFVVICSLGLVVLLYIRYLLGLDVRFERFVNRQQRFWVYAHQLLHRLERALLLAVTATSLLLYWFFGQSSAVLSSALGTLSLGRVLLVLLCIAFLVALVRVARPKGMFERLLVQLDAFACALLLWRDPLDTSALQVVQRWDFSFTLPSSLIAFCLVGMMLLSFLWLKRPLTPWTRKILCVIFLGALLCACLQGISYLWIMASLVLFMEGLLLAVQVER